MLARGPDYDQEDPGLGRVVQYCEVHGSLFLGRDLHPFAFRRFGYRESPAGEGRGDRHDGATAIPVHRR